MVGWRRDTELEWELLLSTSVTEAMIWWGLQYKYVKPTECGVMHQQSAGEVRLSHYTQIIHFDIRFVHYKQ